MDLEHSVLIEIGDNFKRKAEVDVMADVDRTRRTAGPCNNALVLRSSIKIHGDSLSELADLKDAGIWALKQKGVVTLKGDSDGVEIDPRLGFQATDSLLVKKYASCFFGTDLVPRLLSQRVDTLIIVGCTTSGCVRATAVDAVQTGLRPMVVREAVGDRSVAAHEQSLFDLNAKYADVVSLEETLQYLRTVGHNATA